MYVLNIRKFNPSLGRMGLLKQSDSQRKDTYFGKDPLFVIIHVTLRNEPKRQLGKED